MRGRGLHYWMFVGQIRFQRIISRRVCDAMGLLPGQPKILEFLAWHEGCTQAEIGQGCALEKTAAASLLRRMMESGLVYKEPGEQDRRTTSIYLTSAGREKADEVCARVRAVDERVWQGVDAAGREQFMRTLRRVLLNLEAMEEE